MTDSPPPAPTIPGQQVAGKDISRRRLAERLRREANHIIDLIDPCISFGLDYQAKSLSDMATKLAAMSVAVGAALDDKRHSYD